MKPKSKNVSIFIVLILFLLSIAFSALLYSLRSGTTFPEIPPYLKFPMEILFYVIVLLFINQGRIDVVRWIQEGAAFVFFRIVISLGNSIVFYLAFSDTSQVNFMDTYVDALWNYSPTYLFQFLIAPALTYPLLHLFYADEEQKKLHIPIITEIQEDSGGIDRNFTENRFAPIEVKPPQLEKTHRERLTMKKGKGDKKDIPSEFGDVYVIDEESLGDPSAFTLDED
ncbi:hypothetical protein JW877_03590, partial [bacterium]|nr:hypothetical protein [bacterium]